MLIRSLFNSASRICYAADDAGAGGAPAGGPLAEAAPAAPDPLAALDAPTIMGEEPRDVPVEEKPAGEAKPEGQADGEKPEGDKAALADGVPEKYELKAPEGFAALDAEALEAATPLLQELGVTADKAQGVIDQFAKTVFPAMLERAQSAAQVSQVEQIVAMRAGWADEARADKEYGGSKFDENMALAAKFRDSLATPALREMFNATGIGNHPEMIRLFVKGGRMLAEGKFASGQGGQEKLPLEKRLYAQPGS